MQSINIESGIENNLHLIIWNITISFVIKRIIILMGDFLLYYRSVAQLISYYLKRYYQQFIIVEEN